MPNTLAHLGLQGLVTSAVVPRADLKWIALGCVIPDIPWILQRLARTVVEGDRIYDLRLYAIVQASLAGCLVLSGALALLSARPKRVFLVLSLNSVLHLLLDAAQTKWANGVHFLAPFSWELTNFELFWPENPLTVLLTVGGLAWVAYALLRGLGDTVPLVLPGGWRRLLAVALLAIFVLAPIGLAGLAEAADNHSVKVLRDRAGRPGSEVGFDRNNYSPDDGGGSLRTLAGEDLSVVGWSAESERPISARGRFVDAGTVRLDEVHEHWPLLRDAASRIGLVLVGLIWVAQSMRTYIFSTPIRPSRGRGSVSG